MALLVAVVMVVTTLPAVASAYHTPWGQGESDARDIVVSLATFSPGDDIAQWFGHSALIVHDQHHNRQRMYNYGMFAFDETLIPRFAMGRLEFWVASTPMPQSVQLYIDEDRDVRLIELNLPAERRLELAEFLADNVRPENRYYMYHHYDDNCATRVRDAIDKAVDGQFSEAYEAEPARMTLRDHTRRHTAHNPPMDWLLMYLMNRDIDREITVWDEMFLPGELEKRVLEFDWEDPDGQIRGLAQRNHELYRAEDRPPPPAEPPNHWPWWLLVGLVVAVVGLVIGWTSRKRPGRGSRIRYGLYQLVVGLMMGGPGLVLGVMATFTEHDVTYWNQNLFWANPLTLVVVVLAVMVLRGSMRARRRMVQLWTLLAAVAAVGVVFQLITLWVPQWQQATEIPMALLLPTIAGATAAAWLVDGKRLRDEVESDSDSDSDSEE